MKRGQMVDFFAVCADDVWINCRAAPGEIAGSRQRVRQIAHPTEDWPNPMNWLTLTIVGAVAVWFEYSYRRSRNRTSTKSSAEAGTVFIEQPARVEKLEETPSIAPGSENDKKLNTAV
jgi:hypothetical protein